MKLAHKILTALPESTDEALKKEWVTISNELNQALVKARKFCRTSKLDKEERAVFGLMKDFIAIDNGIQGSGSISEEVSKMCDTGYHNRCKDKNCECGCHSK